jgi:ribonucleoside-diphosphate reductase alpha subunit
MFSSATTDQSFSLMSSLTTFHVVKRNGESEEVSFDKVIRRIRALCDGLSHEINPLLVAQKVVTQIYDGVKTTELDELAAQVCIALETTHLDYGKLASRIIISNNHKNTSPSFSETIYILYHNKDSNGVHCPLIADDVYQIIMNNKSKLNDVLDYQRDYLFDYFGFKTLEKAYLMKSGGKVIERIQHLIMRVSIGIHKEDIKSAIQSYQYMSQKYFTHATPTLYNAGTPRMQLSSCFLLHVGDSVDGLYKATSDMAKISANAGGIGICLSDIRSKGSYIRGVNGTSNGIIPYCRVLNEMSRHINQAGKRPGSIACYLEPHHPEVLQFLELRKNTGAEHERCRDLFTAMWISDLFMKRVEANEMWSFFDPDECPGLSDAYGDAYEELYMKYEAQGKAKGKQMEARKVWNAMLASQIETGTPYIGYKDHVNRKSNQKNVGTIKNSNLCIEITEVSTDDEYAVCNLASLSLPQFVVEKDGNPVFDYEKLVEVTKVAIRNLNKVIDVNYYPVPETKKSNSRMRPVGLGIQGLADVFAMMRLPFDSSEAREVNKKIAEAMYYGAVYSSWEIACDEGPYSEFKGSPMSQGQFQFDMWGVKPSSTYDWDSLREKVMKDGVRNSLLIALMPTASTSQILGNNECFEPYTSNIYTRRTIAGDFVVINKHLVKDLMKLGIWNVNMKNKIIVENGSVQKIDEIPIHIRNLYKTVWEIKQRVVMDLAIDRSPFVCQTSSMNLFFEEPTPSILTSAFMYGWKNGLKTGIYYLRTRPKVQAQQFTIDPGKVPGKKEDKNQQVEEEGCAVCSA